MRIILLLPLILYVALILVNFNLFWQTFQINLFGVQTISIPWIAISTLFIVFYIALIFLAFEGWISILTYKNKKLEKQLILTKAKLYDGQEKLIQEIKNFFEIKLNEKENNLKTYLKQLNKSNEEIFKQYFDKYNQILENIKYINKNSIEQIRLENEKILKKLNLVDENILDKFKQLVKK